MSEFLWYCPIGHLSHIAPNTENEYKCKICFQIENIKKDRDTDLQEFKKELALGNKIIQKCAEIVIRKTGVQIHQCINIDFDPELTPIKEIQPKHETTKFHPADVPGIIEDALAVTLAKPPSSASGELSDDFTNGVRFACQVIRDNYSEPEILRIQMKIIQFELKYRLAIKLFKKDLTDMKQKVNFTKGIYSSLAIQALAMTDEEYENGKHEVEG